LHVSLEETSVLDCRRFALRGLFGGLSKPDGATGLTRTYAISSRRADAETEVHHLGSVQVQED
jgi:hypothetical protein